MKKSVLAIIFMIFIPFYGITQTDSLSTKPYKELALLIEELGQKTPELAIPICKVYLEKSKKENNIDKQWSAYVSFTNLHRNLNNYDIAIKYADSTINIFERHKLSKNGYHTFMAAGRAYTGKDKLSLALKYYNRALIFAKEDDNIEEIIGASYILSSIKSTGGNYDGAIQTQRELINSIKLTDTSSQLSIERKEQLIFASQVSMAHTFMQAKNADSSYHYSNIVLKKGLEMNNSCLIKDLYWLIGNAQLLRKKYDKAKISFENSKKYCLPFSKLDSLAVGSYIGKVYAAKKDYKLAIKEFEKAFSAHELSENEEGFMDDIYRIAAICYKEEGDLEKANFYYEKHINTIQTREKINDTINTSFQNQELDEFKLDLSNLTFVKNKKEKYLNYVFLISSIVILILLLLLLKFYLIKKENEKKFKLLLAKMKTVKDSKKRINFKIENLEAESINEVPKEVRLQIIDGLKKLEVKEYFLNQDCNLYNVAKKIGTNTSYLSKVINSYYGKNFNTYINDLRINYAVIRIKEDVFFRAYSIQSMAEELGYKSANSFTKYFKKDTGLNPSFYIKNIKNIK